MWLSILHLPLLWWSTKDCLDLLKEHAAKHICSNKSFYLVPRLKCTSFRPCQHFGCLSLTAVDVIWKTFSFWTSVGRFRHRKSLRLADDVTVVEVVWWETVTPPPPHMHAELSRGMWGQSLLIDHQCWNAKYRNGKPNSHRRCGGLVFRLSHSSCEISSEIVGDAFGRKKMPRGWDNERMVRGSVCWGVWRSGRWLRTWNSPFNPPSHFLPFSSSRQWSLSEVQTHCHGEWMNEWWHGEVSAHSQFELWPSADLTPCLLVQNVKFQEHRSNFQGWCAVMEITTVSHTWCWY